MRGVRVRTTLVATLVVAIVLAASGITFMLVLRHQFRDSAVQVAKQQADDVASQVTTDGFGPDLPPFVGGEEAVVQILDANGHVALSSAAADGLPPMVGDFPAPGEQTTHYVDSLDAVRGNPAVVVAKGVQTPDGNGVVLAGQNLESVEDFTNAGFSLLAVGYPLVLIVVALVLYWLTGRALAPVGAMRRRVAEITAADLEARVPVSPAGDEISRLAETMNDMLARLQESQDRQRRFVADASHELRSPLTTIRAAQEVAAAHPESVDWLATSADTLAEAERLDRLVSDLLLLARADESGLDLHWSDVDLDDLVGGEVERLRLTTSLVVDVDVTPLQVRGDRYRLERLLRNLTENAARYARTRVGISLQVDESRSGSRVTVEVVDDGPGIPDDQRERVFDRFVRLDESRHRQGGGTGLGLSIAREIAIAHGGTLVAVPAAAAGARFVLTLPLERTPVGVA